MSSFYSSKLLIKGSNSVGNPGNVLITSRNSPKYFYQCTHPLIAIAYMPDILIVVLPNSNF